MFKKIEKEERKHKKRIIKAIKNNDTLLIFTEDNVTGNATKGAIIQMLGLGFEKMLETGILDREDVKLIYDYSMAKNEDEKEKVLQTFEEDMLNELLKEDNTDFTPKKKRGRPRKSA